IINPGVTPPEIVLVETVTVTANPPAMMANRNSSITATVLDKNGKPIPNASVTFSVALQSTAAGDTLNETMDSNGAAVTADAQGQATDTLRTADATGTKQKT